MKLIKQLNDSLKPVDPVQQAINSLTEDWTSQLDDEQVEMLADYMKEMIESSAKRGRQMAPQEAANMALEDVAGFEAASPSIMKATVMRLVQSYLKKFGS